MRKWILPAIAGLMLPAASYATTFDFDLKGTAGIGLLTGNEPGAVVGGSGGEVGTGITYDDVTKILNVSVGWGSSQGFTDLSSLANNSHIHGPTASANGGGFTQTASVLFNLTRSSSAVSGGVFTSPSNTITLTGAQEIDLFNGKFYINLHTVNNGGGEMRGFIVAVPEPTSLAGLAFAGLLLRRKRTA